MPQKVNTPQGGIELNVSGVSQARLPVAKKKAVSSEVYVLFRLPLQCRKCVTALGKVFYVQIEPAYILIRT